MRLPRFGLNIQLIKQRRSTATRPVFAALVLFLFITSSLSAVADGSWPTTRFKVFAGNPYTGPNSNAIGDPGRGGFDYIEFEDLSETLSAEARLEIESAFTEAAQWYKKMGLPAPVLEPLKEDEEGLFYQVYVCKRASLPNFSSCGDNPPPAARPAGSYSAFCDSPGSRSKYMVINRVKAIDGSELTEEGYQTIAHELMHAILANTKFGKRNRSCSVRYWITEGIPDAISFDLVEKKGWETRYSPNNTNDYILKEYGIRAYSKSVAEHNEEDKYTTSSFWRFVADLNGGWKELLTDPKGKGLFDSTMPGRRADDRSREDWKAEVDWLNRALDGKFSRDLSEVYSLFVNNIIFRIPPVEDYRDKSPEQTLPRWAELLYGQCAIVNLKGNTRQTITLELEELSAGCIVVEPLDVPGLIQVSFQSSSPDESLLKDIRIGQAGTAIDVRALRASTKDDIAPGYLAGWLGYQQDGQKRTFYVVSNVALDAKNTKPRMVTLTVTRTEIYNNGIATAPLPVARVAERPMKPSFKKHARSLVQQQAATRRMIEEQMNLDKESLNPNVDSAVNTSRRLNHPDCEEPFKYSVCGPHLIISLGLMPGTFIVPGQTNTQGGPAAQVFAAMQAMSATSLNAGADAQALSDWLDSIDGNKVGIAIPLIDYGYSGTISNAAINVGMSGGKTLRAIGPPDENSRTELRGSVTIDEYSPFVISGSFRAPLAEFDESGAYRSQETISGRFTSAAPWLNDERVTFEMDSIQEMADDIADTMGIPAGMINAMKEDGTMPGYSSSGTNTGAGGSSTEVGCNCECSTKPFADELCELYCEEEFAACEGT